jgi:hypothetical protein
VTDLEHAKLARLDGAALDRVEVGRELLDVREVRRAGEVIGDDVGTGMDERDAASSIERLPRLDRTQDRRQDADRPRVDSLETKKGFPIAATIPTTSVGSVVDRRVGARERNRRGRQRDHEAQDHHRFPLRRTSRPKFDMRREENDDDFAKSRGGGQLAVPPGVTRRTTVRLFREAARHRASSARFRLRVGGARDRVPVSAGARASVALIAGV